MKTIAEAEITATFQKTTACWSKISLHYYDIVKGSPKSKKIKMQLAYLQDKPEDTILKFIGGPTGFESYYIKDLLDHRFFPKPDIFCICAGTINSYEKCTVKWSDVLKFLKANGYSINE